MYSLPGNEPKSKAKKSVCRIVGDGVIPLRITCEGDSTTTAIVADAVAAAAAAATSTTTINAV